MRPVHFLNACVWFHNVTSFLWCVWCDLSSSRTCFYIDASDSQLWLTSTRTQTIPDASEKDVTSRNQTHALKRRTGRMPCAYSLTHWRQTAQTPVTYREADHEKQATLGCLAQRRSLADEHPTRRLRGLIAGWRGRDNGSGGQRSVVLVNVTGIIAWKGMRN